MIKGFFKGIFISYEFMVFCLIQLIVFIPACQTILIQLEPYITPIVRCASAEYGYTIPLAIIGWAGYIHEQFKKAAFPDKEGSLPKFVLFPRYNEFKGCYHAGVFWTACAALLYLLTLIYFNIGSISISSAFLELICSLAITTIALLSTRNAIVTVNEKYHRASAAPCPSRRKR